MKFPKFDRFRIAMGAGILLVVIIVGGLGWAFFQQLALAEELREETRQLKQAVATQQAHQAHLTATLTYVQTDTYVEEWARTEPGMVKPGEVLVIPVAGSGSDAPASTPTAQPQDAVPPAPDDRPFWVVWWEALTGSGQ
jgi:cell division protein FtsB